jgi:tetratricopeptide (TPR) repeat protein
MQVIDEVSALGESGWLGYLQMNLADIYYRTGNISRAAEECQNSLNKTLENASVRGKIAALHLKGLIALEMNDWNEARICAEEIKQAVDNWLNPKLMRHYYHLMGHIYMEENKIQDAIANFEKAVALLPFEFDPEGDEHAPFYDSLAFAFFRAKDLENARRWYENILALTSGRIYYGDIYAKSFFMLGRIYEEKGWKGKAIESYQKFLDLWKDADPNIPEIEDAGLHLAALKD